MCVTTEDLTDKKKIDLVVFAQYSGNKSDKAIAETVTAEEIACHTNLKKARANSMGKVLFDEGVVSKPENAVYNANPGSNRISSVA